MVKGFIFFRDGKIPFVIENYCMELFTDDSLLDDFCKEYNFKENYILHIKIHGNTQGEDDLRQVCPNEVQVWKQAFSGERILCGHGREEQGRTGRR